jgi:hypothetical protein
MRKVVMKYLKAISCFNFVEHQNNHNKKIIEFKANDNLDYCTITPCYYYIPSLEVAKTILNIPWESKPIIFSMKVLKSIDNGIVQIIHIDGEWRRRQFSNSLTTWWGEWINIEKTIDNIFKNENIQKFLTENWNRCIIDKNYIHKKERRCKVTIDEIIRQIREGSQKAYRNKIC